MTYHPLGNGMSGVQAAEEAREQEGRHAATSTGLLSR